MIRFDVNLKTGREIRHPHARLSNFVDEAPDTPEREEAFKKAELVIFPENVTMPRFAGRERSIPESL